MERIKINKYDQAIKEFVYRSYPDKTKEWMKAPFTYKNYVMATNGHIMCRIPETLPEDKYVELIEGKTVKYPEEANTNIVLDVNYLLYKLSDLPRIDEYDYIGQDVDCKCCEGSGLVDFKFEYKGKCYTESFDCPICKGDGLEEKIRSIPNGNKIIDKDEYICKIGIYHYSCYYISLIVKVAHSLELKEILLSHQKSENGLSVFKIGKVVEVLLMSMIINNDKHKLVFEI
jgi:hypothetical protein